MLRFLRLASLAALLVASPVAGQQSWGLWTPGAAAFGDWRWSSPVADEASLPLTGTPGMCRSAIAEGTLCCWTGAAWVCTGGVDDDVPEVGDFGALALSGDVTSTGLVTTIVANAVALGTDTTGGYATSLTEGGAATTATALAANGANCSAGQASRGVDASGAAEDCFTAASPGGSDTHVQYNDGGVLGGESGLVFNESTDALTVGGSILSANGGTAGAPTFSFSAATTRGMWAANGGIQFSANSVNAMGVYGDPHVRIAGGEGVTFTGPGGDPSASSPVSGLKNVATGVSGFTSGDSTTDGTWQVGDPGTRPTCEEAVRGRYWHDFGGAGVADVIAVCCKTVGDTYVWATAIGTCS